MPHPEGPTLDEAIVQARTMIRANANRDTSPWGNVQGTPVSGGADDANLKSCSLKGDGSKVVLEDWIVFYRDEGGMRMADLCLNGSQQITFPNSRINSIHEFEPGVLSVYEFLNDPSTKANGLIPKANLQPDRLKKLIGHNGKVQMNDVASLWIVSTAKDMSHIKSVTVYTRDADPTDPAGVSGIVDKAVLKAIKMYSQQGTFFDADAEDQKLLHRQFLDLITQETEVRGKDPMASGSYIEIYPNKTEFTALADATDHLILASFNGFGTRTMNDVLRYNAQTKSLELHIGR